MSMLDFHIAGPEEKREAFQSVHSIWPHALDPDVHLVKRLHAVQQNRAEWFVGRSSTGVEVSCGAYPFTLFGPNQGIRRAMGLGAVYTHPRARGHGYAGQLINHLREHYRQKGIEDFFLYSDIDPGFYERLGFHRLPSRAFAFAPKALDGASAWTIQSIDVRVEDPGLCGHEFGLQLSHEEIVWGYAKHEGPLQMTLFSHPVENLNYWALSSLAKGEYTLLMSNIPQSAKNWPLFRELIAADCAHSQGQSVKGWLTSPSSDGDEIQRDGAFGEISERKDGILMWTSFKGEKDPWYPEICRKGFLTFPLLQF
jgi:GNAT superfamily N-acetyltransferase